MNEIDKHITELFYNDQALNEKPSMAMEYCTAYANTKADGCPIYNFKSINVQDIIYNKFIIAGAEFYIKHKIQDSVQANCVLLKFQDNSYVLGIGYLTIPLKDIECLKPFLTQNQYSTIINS